MKVLMLSLLLAQGTEAKPSQEEGISFATPQELYDAIQSGVPMIIVDVRSPAAYARGHIPGAVNVPISDLRAGFDPGFPKDADIVLYCDCPHGGIALTGARILRDMGYTNLWIMLKGTRYWPGDLESSQDQY